MLNTSVLSMDEKYAIARAAGLMEMSSDNTISADVEAEIALMTPEDAFKFWCQWKGFGGHGGRFIEKLDGFRSAKLPD